MAYDRWSIGNAAMVRTQIGTALREIGPEDFDPGYSEEKAHHSGDPTTLDFRRRDNTYWFRTRRDWQTAVDTLESRGFIVTGRRS